MVSKHELKEAYIAIHNIPFVDRAIRNVKYLTKKNEGLKQEIRTLKKVIDQLLDKRLSTNNSCCCSSKCNKSVPNIEIKKEKKVVDLSTEEKKHDENIVYKILTDPKETDEIEISSEDLEYYKSIAVNKDELNSETKNEEIKEKEEEGLEQLIKEDESRLHLFKRLEEEEEVEVEEEEQEEVEVEETEEEEEEEQEEVEVEETEEEEEEVEVEETEEEVEVEETEEEEEEEEVEVEETEEEEVEVEETEEEEEEEEVEVEETEEEEEEVYEITIKNKSYYTTNETNGPIYAVLADEDVGDQIGEFKDGRAVFYRKKK